MARKTLIAGNWKLNLTVSDGVSLAQAISTFVSQSKNRDQVEVVVCPTFVCLFPVAQAVGETIGVGGQHCFWEDKGAFTGEISASQLKAVGARYVIIGHSERRQFFYETDDSVNRRLKAALAAGLVPIVCVGETLADRDAGRLQMVLATQVKGCLLYTSPSPRD